MASSSEPSDIYEVERIIAVKIDKSGERVYRVRWVGFTAESDTWEPYRNLLTCKDLVKEFRLAQIELKKLIETSNTRRNKNKNNHGKVDECLNEGEKVNTSSINETQTDIPIKSMERMKLDSNSYSNAPSDSSGKDGDTAESHTTAVSSGSIETSLKNSTIETNSSQKVKKQRPFPVSSTAPAAPRIQSKKHERKATEGCVSSLLTDNTKLSSKNSTQSTVRLKNHPKADCSHVIQKQKAFQERSTAQPGQKIQSGGNECKKKPVKGHVNADRSECRPTSDGSKNSVSKAAVALPNLPKQSGRPSKSFEERRQVQFQQNQSDRNVKDHSTSTVHLVSTEDSSKKSAAAPLKNVSKKHSIQSIEKQIHVPVRSASTSVPAEQKSDSGMTTESRAAVSVRKRHHDQQLPDTTLPVSRQRAQNAPAQSQQHSSKTTSQPRPMDIDRVAQCDTDVSLNKHGLAATVSKSPLSSASSDPSNVSSCNTNPDNATRMQTSHQDTAAVVSHHQLEESLIGQIEDDDAINPLIKINEDLAKAVTTGNYEDVCSIISSSASCDLEQANERGTTLLMAAAMRGYSDIVKVLVQNGANINAHHVTGSTPLIQATECGHFSTVVVLLALGTHLNKQTVRGNTALMEAGHHNRVQIAIELLQNGADFSVKNQDGMTAFDFAKHHKYKVVEAVICKHVDSVTKVFESCVRSTITNSAQIIHALFPIHNFSLNEGTSFTIPFVYNKTEPLKAGFGMLLYIAQSLISPNELKCRLHGKCAIESVTLNGMKQTPLTADGHYILSFGPVVEGHNRIIINTRLSPTTQVKLVVCAYKMKLLGNSKVKI